MTDPNTIHGSINDSATNERAALIERLRQPKALLDHGYVQLIDAWGSDERIVEAARMSTGRGFVSWDPYVRCKSCDAIWQTNIKHEHTRAYSKQYNVKLGGQNLADVEFMALIHGSKSCTQCEPAGPDAVLFEKFPRGDFGLLEHLWKAKHSTPFEMAGMTVESQAPIFDYREWHRHRTQTFAEMSARYGPLPNFNYVPTLERLMSGAGHVRCPDCDGSGTIGGETLHNVIAGEVRPYRMGGEACACDHGWVLKGASGNKQAGALKGSATLTVEAAERFRSNTQELYAAIELAYQEALKDGVPKELARIILPVGRYSRMMATANLRNWLGFSMLRATPPEGMPPQAQYEIRVYADAIDEMVAQVFPKTWQIFAAERLAARDAYEAKQREAREARAVK